MKVTMIRKAEYDLKTDGGNLTAIPNELFNGLVGLNDERFDPGVSEHAREVAYFDSKADYVARAAEFDIDPSQPVYVDAKGHIFCFLKEEGGVSENGAGDDKPAAAQGNDNGGAAAE